MAVQKPTTLTILGDSAAEVCNDEFCVIPLRDVAPDAENGQNAVAVTAAN
ncbi:MAG TPA: hypothetical protein VGM94_09795 [Galbitalea sp.]|jgi:hypothetical protein